MDNSQSTLEHKFEELERTGPEAELTDAMVAYSLNHANWQWLYGRLKAIATTRTQSLRGLAYTCIGHLARLHAEFPAHEALQFLAEALKQDPANAGLVEDAISDIRVFRER